jgi:hypothetical protein
MHDLSNDREQLPSTQEVTDGGNDTDDIACHDNIACHIDLSAGNYRVVAVISVLLPGNLGIAGHIDHNCYR